MFESVTVETIAPTPTIFFLSFGGDSATHVEILASEQKYRLPTVVSKRVKEWSLLRKEYQRAVDDGNWMVSHNCELSLEMEQVDHTEADGDE